MLGNIRIDRNWLQTPTGVWPITQPDIRGVVCGMAVLGVAEPLADFSGSDDPFRLVRVDRSGREAFDTAVLRQRPGELLCLLFGFEGRSPSRMPVGWSIALINEGDVPDVVLRHVVTSEIGSRCENEALPG